MILEIKHKGTTVKIIDDGNYKSSTVIKWKDENTEIIRLITSIIEGINESKK